MQDFRCYRGKYELRNATFRKISDCATPVRKAYNVQDVRWYGRHCLLDNATICQKDRGQGSGQIFIMVSVQLPEPPDIINPLIIATLHVQYNIVYIKKKKST